MTDLEIEHDPDELDDILPDEDIEVTVGFEAEHAKPVNYGTDPHWPPLTPMLGWTNRMGWDNPGLDESMSEDEMWDEVSRRRAAREPLPAAYWMARHIAENGTKPMLFVNDTLAHARQRGESWVADQNYDETTPAAEIVEDFADWTLQEAIFTLRTRVSNAATGDLEDSAYGPNLQS